MKILHISEYCHAGSIGGTERYVLDLIRGLRSQGVASRIGWLCRDQRAAFESEGIPIHPLPTALMRVDEPPGELASAVTTLLAEFRPDVMHFHTLGLTEMAVARLARQQGIPSIFTYHSQGWTCRREDLMIWGGSQPCDGEVRALRCAACKFQERTGGPPVVGYMGALLSAPLDWLFRRSSSANFRRRVCVLSDTRRYRQALREFLGDCALVVSCSEWGKPIMIVNGARPDRVKIIPQGVPHDFVVAAQGVATSRLPRPAGKPFTIGYIGRVTGVKGVDILAEGFSRVPGDDLRLKIYGYVADEKSVSRLNRNLRALARKDTRIELCPKLSLSEMVNAYAELDLVAIPSVWQETGPLVLFEALQMGVPVFGSNRLGHPRVLMAGGMVVEPNTPPGWQTALTNAAGEFRNGQWENRRERIRNTLKLSSMADVAQEMVVAYSDASHSGKL